MDSLDHNTIENNVPEHNIIDEIQIAQNIVGDFIDNCNTKSKSFVHNKYQLENIELKDTIKDQEELIKNLKNERNLYKYSIRQLEIENADRSLELSNEALKTELSNQIEEFEKNNHELALINSNLNIETNNLKNQIININKDILNVQNEKNVFENKYKELKERFQVVENINNQHVSKINEFSDTIEQLTSELNMTKNNLEISQDNLKNCNDELLTYKTELLTINEDKDKQIKALSEQLYSMSKVKGIKIPIGNQNQIPVHTIPTQPIRKPVVPTRGIRVTKR